MWIRSAWIVLLGARNACRTEQVSFEIGFEGGVGVDRSKMRREGVPNRGASMPKTMRGESNLGKRLGEKIEVGGVGYHFPVKFLIHQVYVISSFLSNHYGSLATLLVHLIFYIVRYIVILMSNLETRIEQSLFFFLISQTLFATIMFHSFHHSVYLHFITS